MNRILIVCVVTTLVAAVAGAGTVTPIDEFVGTHNEDWESFDNYLDGGRHHEPDGTSIFGGIAEISAGDRMAIYDPVLAAFGLGTSGPAQVADGVQGLGIDGLDVTATINFSQPVSDFGAFWGASTNNNDPEPIDFSFYDTDNNLIDSASFLYSRSPQRDGMLLWAGWHSDTPIGRVTYNAEFTVTDDMRVVTSTTPEPASLALLAVGGLVAFRRNRR
jgi:hypothetical protein